MEIKLAKLNTIKEILSSSDSDKLLSAFNHIIDILNFINLVEVSDINDIPNIVNNKLNDLKEKREYLYYKSIKLVYVDYVSQSILPEILTNLLVNSLNNSKNIVNDYFTVMAFSCFSNELVGEGYLKALPDYLLSHFNINFLTNNWEYIEERLSTLKTKE